VHPHSHRRSSPHSEARVPRVTVGALGNFATRANIGSGNTTHEVRLCKVDNTLLPNLAAWHSHRAREVPEQLGISRRQLLAENVPVGWGRDPGTLTRVGLISIGAIAYSHGTNAGCRDAIRRTRVEQRVLLAWRALLTQFNTLCKTILRMASCLPKSGTKEREISRTHPADSEKAGPITQLTAGIAPRVAVLVAPAQPVPAAKPRAYPCLPPVENPVLVSIGHFEQETLFLPRVPPATPK